MGGGIYSSPATQLDTELFSTSINAVQNKAIKTELDKLEQSIVFAAFGGSTDQLSTNKSDWVIEGTSAYYVYEEDIPSSWVLLTCDLDNYKVLKNVVKDNRLIIYYPNTNIPDDGVHLGLRIMRLQ